MRLLSILAVCTCTAVAGMAAQESGFGEAPRAPDQGITAQEKDRYFAAWLLVENNNEIALAQLALQRAHDPEVKQFAQKMVDDHEKMGHELGSFASSLDYTPMASTQPPGEARAKERPTPRASGSGDAKASGSAGTGGFDHIALLKELGTQCLDSTRKELEQKQGTEFDQCFVHMAVGAHVKASDAMTVFERHVSEELKKVLTNGQKTVTEHLDHAKELARKCESKATSAGERGGR